MEAPEGEVACPGFASAELKRAPESPGWVPEAGSTFDSWLWQHVRGTNKDTWDGTVPPYSTSEEWAFKVILHDSLFMAYRGLSSRAGCDYRICRGYPNTDVYWVEYMTPSGLKKGPPAKTLPMAICLAAWEALSKGGFVVPAPLEAKK